MKDGKHTKTELKDGTAMVLKMWREIGDRVDPFQLALVRCPLPTSRAFPTSPISQVL
jgi:hypothetical protein